MTESYPVDKRALIKGQHDPYAGVTDRNIAIHMQKRLQRRNYKNSGNQLYCTGLEAFLHGGVYNNINRCQIDAEASLGVLINNY